MLGRRRVNPFSMPVGPGGATPLPPQAQMHWWHPSNPYVGGGPDWFVSRLHDIDSNLSVTWDNYAERWVMWVRKPKVKTGWVLLFPVQHADGSYAPLDERTFAKLYEISGDKWGNAKSYFNRVVAEWERDTQKAVESRKQSVADSSGDFYDHTKIRVGYGPSSGSKFTRYWA